MNLAAIAACSIDRVVGLKGQIPWHSPKDLMYFKKMTEDAILIMGRKTLESLPGLLSKRIHIVITSNTVELTHGAWYQAQLNKRSKEELAQKVYLVTSADEAIKKAEELLKIHRGLQNTIYIAGGGQIYEQMLPKCCIVYLTRVTTPYKVEGDTYFPELESSQWRLIKQVSLKDGDISLDFQMYLAQKCSESQEATLRFNQVLTTL